MLASFRRTFCPTDEERAQDRAMLEEIYAKAIAKKSCSACVFSHTASNGHYSWTECEPTGEDVTFYEGMDCWVERELPEDAML